MQLGVFQVAPDRGSAKNTLRISNQALGTFRGGSLPNVSARTPTVKTAAHIKDSNKVTCASPQAKVLPNDFVAIK